MSRGLASAFQTAIGETVLYPAFFVEFDFASGKTRYWTGDTNLSADFGDGSVTWTGGGLFGSVKTSGEVESIASRNLIFTLNGVDQTYYATAVSTKYRGRAVKLWFALMNSAGTAISYYYLMEEGRMDTLAINEQEDTITLTLSCESRLVDMFLPRRSFLSNTDLQKTYPTDKFYEFTPMVPMTKLPWGMYRPGKNKSVLDKILNNAGENLERVIPTKYG